MPGEHSGVNSIHGVLMSMGYEEALVHPAVKQLGLATPWQFTDEDVARALDYMHQLASRVPDDVRKGAQAYVPEPSQPAQASPHEALSSTCALCMQALHSGGPRHRLAECGHEFHLACLRSYAEIINTCIICSNSFDAQAIHKQAQRTCANAEPSFVSVNGGAREFSLNRSSHEAVQEVVVSPSAVDGVDEDVELIKRCILTSVAGRAPAPAPAPAPSQSSEEQLEYGPAARSAVSTEDLAMLKRIHLAAQGRRAPPREPQAPAQPAAKAHIATARELEARLLAEAEGRAQADGQLITSLLASDGAHVQAMDPATSRTVARIVEEEAQRQKREEEEDRRAVLAALREEEAELERQKRQEEEDMRAALKAHREEEAAAERAAEERQRSEAEDLSRAILLQLDLSEQVGAEEAALKAQAAERRSTHVNGHSGAKSGDQEQLWRTLFRHPTRDNVVGAGDSIGPFGDRISANRPPPPEGSRALATRPITRDSRVILIDGANVAYGYARGIGRPPGAVEFDGVVFAIRWLEAKGYEPTAIIHARWFEDSNLERSLSDECRRALSTLQGMLGRQVTLAPPRNDDDEVIINLAAEYGCHIVTNDNYDNHVRSGKLTRAWVQKTTRKYAFWGTTFTFASLR